MHKISKLSIKKNYGMAKYLSNLDLMNKYISNNVYDLPVVKKLTYTIRLSSFKDYKIELSEEFLKVIYFVFYLLYGNRPYIKLNNNYFEKKSLNSALLESFWDKYTFKYSITNLEDIYENLSMINLGIIEKVDKNLKNEEYLCLKHKYSSFKYRIFINSTSIPGLNEILAFCSDEILCENFLISLDIFIKTKKLENFHNNILNI